MGLTVRGLQGPTQARSPSASSGCSSPVLGKSTCSPQACVALDHDNEELKQCPPTSATFVSQAATAVPSPLCSPQESPDWTVVAAEPMSLRLDPPCVQQPAPTIFAPRQTSRKRTADGGDSLELAQVGMHITAVQVGGSAGVVGTAWKISAFTPDKAEVLSRHINVGDFLWEVEDTCVGTSVHTVLEMCKILAERKSVAGKFCCGVRTPIELSYKQEEKIMSISSAPTRQVILNVLSQDQEEQPNLPHCKSVTSGEAAAPRAPKIGAHSSPTLEALGMSLGLSLGNAMGSLNVFSEFELSPPPADQGTHSLPALISDADDSDEKLGALVSTTACDVYDFGATHSTEDHKRACCLQAAYKQMQGLYRQQCAIANIMRHRGKELSAGQLTSISETNKHLRDCYNQTRQRVDRLMQVQGQRPKSPPPPWRPSAQTQPLPVCTGASLST